MKHRHNWFWNWGVDLAMAILIALAALILFTGCCPKIINETTAERTVTRADTVYIADTLFVQAETLNDFPIDVAALCDSLLKRNTETFTQTQKQNANTKTNSKPDISQVIFKRDSSGFNLQVDVSAYTRIIDSMRTHITVQDSIFRERTVTVSKCDKKFHIFTVYFFYMVCGIIVLFILGKWFKPL
jgi:hypothetical protein